MHTYPRVIGRFERQSPQRSMTANYDIKQVNRLAVCSSGRRKQSLEALVIRRPNHLFISLGYMRVIVATERLLDHAELLGDTTLRLPTRNQIIDPGSIRMLADPTLKRT